MAEPRTRHIKIQAGVVKRIMKEKFMYEKECLQNEARIQKMKNDGKDEYDIRKMGEVLAESQMMVPDCIKRLRTAAEDLRNKLTDTEEELHASPDFVEGTKQLKEADEMLTVQQF